MSIETPDLETPNLDNLTDLNNANETQSKGGIQKLYDWSGSWTGTIIIVLGIMFFIVQAFVIPSGSMKNSLLVGDMLFVKKFAYGIPLPKTPGVLGLPSLQLVPDFNGNGHLIEGDKPQRGDIVVFLYPHDPKVHYVKRCVATGGDILFLKDKDLYLHPKDGNEYVKKHFKNYELIELDNKLFIKNPYEKEHPGIHHDDTITRENSPHIQLFDLMPIIVPEGEFFMMGDNRDHSNDSRFWGSVNYKYIIGTPWLVYFSWDENYQIRWDRVFQTPESLENTKYTNEKSSHTEGIY